METQPQSVDSIPAEHYGRKWAHAWIRLEQYGGLWHDHECVMGYDEGLETYYFQSGDAHNGRPVVWLGTRPNQFPVLQSLWDAMPDAGVLSVEWKFGTWGTPPEDEDEL